MQGPGNCEDQTSCSQVQERKTKFDSREEKNNFSNQNNAKFPESCILPTGTLKRGPTFFYSQDRAHEGLMKFRAIEKDGRCQRVGAVDLSLVHEKVDSYVYARKLPRQKEICSLLDHGVTKLSEMNEEKTKMYDAVKNSHVRTLECDDSVISSVGSCSMASNPLEWPSRILACHHEGAEEHSSDAESTCQMPNEEANCLVSIEEELAAEIHRLELHAYRCTMEALHASGPLSWAQETLITNLRISLHISNDEHLMELRNLISNSTSIPAR